MYYVYTLAYMYMYTLAVASGVGFLSISCTGKVYAMFNLWKLATAEQICVICSGVAVWWCSLCLSNAVVFRYQEGFSPI